MKMPKFSVSSFNEVVSTYFAAAHTDIFNHNVALTNEAFVLNNAIVDKILPLEQAEPHGVAADSWINSRTWANITT